MISRTFYQSLYAFFGKKQGEKEIFSIKVDFFSDFFRNRGLTKKVLYGIIKNNDIIRYNKMFELKRNNTLYQQIAEYFEQEIREGRLKPGYKFPPTTELSKQFKVNPDTIQQSLRILMNQGLISRAPKRGTFVREAYHGNTIGIVFGKEIFEDNNLAFFSVFLSELIQYAESKGWKTRIFMTVKESPADTALYELRKAVEAGELAGICDFCSSFVAKDYLAEKCPIPVCGGGVTDIEQLLQLGLKTLLSRGYSDIEIFANGGTEKYRKELEKILVKLQGTHPALHFRIMEPLQKEGYREFKAMWLSDRHPDAVLITNDCIFRGVWYAVMELNIKVPDELGLITHINKGCEPLTHIPITSLEVTPFDFAKKSFDRLESLILGTPYHYRSVTATLREGKTC